MTPETDARKRVENAVVSVDNDIPSPLDGEDTESLNSDEPIATQKRQRRKVLHHPAMRSNAYGETQSDDPSQPKSNKRRKLRKNQPVKDAYIEFPEDAHDIFEASSAPSSDFEELYSQPAKGRRAPDMSLASEGRQFSLPGARRARDIPSDFEERHATRSKVPRVPKIPIPEKILFPRKKIFAPKTSVPLIPLNRPRNSKGFDSYDFRATKTGFFGHMIMRKTLDLYIGLDSNNNNLDVILTQDNPIAKPSRKDAKRSRFPKHSRSQPPLPCTA